MSDLGYYCPLCDDYCEYRSKMAMLWKGAAKEYRAKYKRLVEALTADSVRRYSYHDVDEFYPDDDDEFADGHSPLLDRHCGEARG